uniref:Hedgehog protein Hint domain-containing protein n=1 Tax=Alexandrium monilatum TaxID=311494 RepID=A0A7S4QDF5_9DINO
MSPAAALLTGLGSCRPGLHGPAVDGLGCVPGSRTPKDAEPASQAQAVALRRVGTRRRLGTLTFFDQPQGPPPPPPQQPPPPQPPRKDDSENRPGGGGDAAANVGKAVGEAAATGASAVGTVGSQVAQGAGQAVGSAAGSAASAAAETAGNVASDAADAVGCFPGLATVRERRRGVIRISTVGVGDELVGLDNAPSRVIALLHANADVLAEYLHLEHAGGELAISSRHLLRARCRRRGGRRHFDEVQLREMAGATPSSASRAVVHERGIPEDTAWEWVAAEAIRPGDQLQDAHGQPSAVRVVRRAEHRGAFAPLTADSAVLVDGVLCSCFAPPQVWPFPHATCHAAMLPLRLLDGLRLAAERWSRPGGGKEPLLTVEALWLFPPGGDCTLHPYAAGLLGATEIAAALHRLWKARRPLASPAQPGAAVKLAPA